MDGLTLRDARAGDLDAMVALLSQLFAIEADFTPDPEKQGRGLRLMLARPESAKLLVAERGGQVVGMLTAQILVSTAQGTASALLEDMVVDAACRGQGIGSALLTAMQDWASQAGITRLQLLADRENHPALAFYAREGWQQTQLMALRKPLGSTA